MKRLLLALAFGVMSIGAYSSPVQADTQADCSITSTGDKSNNSCTTKQTYTCEIVNNNAITVKDSNQQIAWSGDASALGNTKSGTVSTGNASNSNSTKLNISVTNDNACTAVAVVQPPVTPTTPTTPTVPTPTPGGMGSSAPLIPVQAPKANQATVLPDTSAESTSAFVTVVIILLSGIAIGSKFLIAGYRSLRI